MDGNISPNIKKGGVFMQYIIPAILIVIIGVIISYLKIVPQATEFVIERLGKYNKTWRRISYIILSCCNSNKFNFNG